MARPLPRFKKERTPSVGYAMSAGDPKHVANLVASHEFVEKHFVLEDVYSPKGASTVQRLAARSSHHPCPFGLSLQVGLLSATNGASVAIWPGSLCPLSALLLNVNLVQTRKSQVTAALQQISDVVQEACRRRVREACGDHDAGKLKLKSCTLTSFTEATLWERCASDWQQCPSGHVPGRVHFSTCLNLDEAYKFLRYLGLTSGGKGALCGVCVCVPLEDVDSLQDGADVFSDTFESQINDRTAVARRADCKIFFTVIVAKKSWKYHLLYQHVSTSFSNLVFLDESILAGGSTILPVFSLSLLSFSFFVVSTSSWGCVRW